jgi:hypothetical protein
VSPQNYFTNDNTTFFILTGSNFMAGATVTLSAWRKARFCRRNMMRGGRRGAT